jgi:hypothetical protein
MTNFTIFIASILLFFYNAGILFVDANAVHFPYYIMISDYIYRVLNSHSRHTFAYH